MAHKTSRETVNIKKKTDRQTDRHKNIQHITHGKKTATEKSNRQTDD